jgi:thioredoxin-related protein
MQIEKINTKEKYDLYISDGIKALYYSTEECGVCQTMKPKVFSIFHSAPLEIKEISINEMREVAAQQLILKSPTLIVYDNAKEILRMSGFLDLARLKYQLERMLS